MKKRQSIALIENREGKFVGPSSQIAANALDHIDLPANLRTFVPDPAGAESNPIATMIWIQVNKNYPDVKKAVALTNLLSWRLSKVQEVTPTLGHISLLNNVASRSLAALQSIRVNMTIDALA
jgi:phosphate transport system substrate-binding protein